jgi:hypothetical protein
VPGAAKQTRTHSSSASKTVDSQFVGPRLRIGEKGLPDFAGYFRLLENSECGKRAFLSSLASFLRYSESVRTFSPCGQRRKPALGPFERRLN